MKATTTKTEREAGSQAIRSELTHEQDVALVHSPPSNEIIERIQRNLATQPKEAGEGYGCEGA